MSVFIGTNIPMYVAGRAHRYKEPSLHETRFTPRSCGAPGSRPS